MPEFDPEAEAETRIVRPRRGQRNGGLPVLKAEALRKLGENGTKEQAEAILERPICGHPLKQVAGQPRRFDPFPLCPRWPTGDSGFCRRHQPGGVASSAYKHGRYSRHMPAKLIEYAKRAAKNADLLNLSDDIVLIESMLADRLAALDGLTDEEAVGTRKEIRDLVEQRRKQVESEVNRTAKGRELFAAISAGLMMRFAEIIERNVHDRETLAAITRELRGLSLVDAGRPN